MQLGISEVKIQEYQSAGLDFGLGADGVQTLATKIRESVWHRSYVVSLVLLEYGKATIAKIVYK